MDQREQREQRKDTQSAEERRRYSRAPSDRGVQCWKLSGTIPVWGKLRDLSPDGCFIETVTPFPIGTQVRLLVMLFGWQLRAEGEVRVSTKRGMGVMFTGLRPEDADRLHSSLNRMAPAGKQPAMNSETLVKAIEKWFKTNDSLPHAAFLRMRAGESPDPG